MRAGAVGISSKEVVEEALVSQTFTETPLLVNGIPQQRRHNFRKGTPE
jgi:hypothetical protein